MKKRIMAGVLATLLVAGTATAGLPVIDVEHILQAVTTYRLIKEQFEWAKAEARRLPNPSRWFGPHHVWNRIGRYADRHGTVSPNVRIWIDAMNNGRNTIDAWRDRVHRWPFPYQAAVADLHHDAKTQIQRDMEEVDLIDNAGETGMQSVGQTREYGMTHEDQLARLESVELNSGPDNHTLNMLTHRANLYSRMQAQEQMGTNKMLASMLDLQLIEARRERNARAAAIEASVLGRQRRNALMDRIAADAQSLNRWP